MRTRLRWFPTAIVLICSLELFVGILPAQQQKAAAPQGIDALTAPIALYPDAPGRTGSGRLDEPRRGAGFRQLAQTEHESEGQ